MLWFWWPQLWFEIWKESMLNATERRREMQPPPRPKRKRK